MECNHETYDVLFDFFLSRVGILKEFHVLIDFASFYSGVSPFFVYRSCFVVEVNYLHLFLGLVVS